MGWIKIDRQILDHWLWKDDEPFDKRSAWIDLLMLANFEDKKIAYKGEVITCERGVVNLSILALSKRWHWSRAKVTRYLTLLESDKMVTTNVTTNRTTITIEKYRDFQDYVTTDVTTNVTTSEQRANSECYNERTQLKNIKNIKKDNKSFNLNAHAREGNEGNDDGQFINPNVRASHEAYKKMMEARNGSAEKII